MLYASRLFAIALALSQASGAELYVCMSNSRGYVVGSKLQPSGVFTRTAAGEWEHRGYNHPIMTALDYDPRDPSTLFLAAGNGLIRASNGGRDWTILTGHEVTELRDVAFDRKAPGTIYFAHSAGVRVSQDGGATWRDANGKRRRKYTESIRVDRQRTGRLVAGGEDGILLSEDGGRSWRLSGASGFQVMHIEQSPHDPCLWIAVTQQGGVFVSRDCAVSFENSGNLGVGTNLYDAAFDPAAPNRVAVAGWVTGVHISEDAGKTWQPRNSGLGSTNVWSVAFDPAQSGRMFASVHEDAVYVSGDAGKSWRSDGLQGSVVYRMFFVGAERAR